VLYLFCATNLSVEFVTSDSFSLQVSPGVEFAFLCLTSYLLAILLNEVMKIIIINPITAKRIHSLQVLQVKFKNLWKPISFYIMLII